jgi:hypothetical protein
MRSKLSRETRITNSLTNLNVTDTDRLIKKTCVPAKGKGRNIIFRETRSVRDYILNQKRSGNYLEFPGMAMNDDLHRDPPLSTVLSTLYLLRNGARRNLLRLEVQSSADRKRDVTVWLLKYGVRVVFRFQRQFIVRFLHRGNGVYYQSDFVSAWYV